MWLKLNPVLLGLAMLAAVPAPSRAQDEGPVFRALIECRADADDLCRDVRPGMGRIAACLYSHMDQLRPGCHKAVEMGLAIKACAWDAKQFCNDVMPGGGRIAACLSAVRERLSPDCRSVVGFWAGARERRDGPADRWDERQDRDRLK